VLVLDLTGQRFGLLTACERRPTPPSDRKKNRYWECVCECGQRVTVRANHLRSGATRSCGCKRTYDLWGQRFGRLVVVDRSEKQLDGLRRWVCECDCGARNVLRFGWQLRARDSVSCGCALRDAQAEFAARALKARRRESCEP
jgi:hypothetical protein